MEDKNLVISFKTILLFLLTVFFIWIFWLIRDVLLFLFVSLILALALEPFVNFLVRKKFHRGFSVVFVVLTMLFIVVGLASVSLVPFIHQTQILIANFPNYMRYLSEIPGAGEYVSKFNDGIFSQLNQSGGSVINFTLGAFSGVLSLVLIFVFTIYMLIDSKNLRLMFVDFFEDGRRDEIQRLVTKIETRLGSWLRGQIFLMFIIGLLIYIGLLIIGMDYALALAVIAGLLEIVPIIGPIISVVPAALIAFFISPVLGVGVIVLYIVIQQLENNLIVPKVMQRAIGFNPLITIVALMVGGQLLGIVGAILAIPILITVYEVFKYVIKDKT
ncbi:hypothetical protein CO058_00755 [candidate division WWE3 bacterium CG_4_9_14_0_2_um_filter_35_11]|uniref:AI-2E family transporter n=1 Tax=candidate division WWE3 bacterium CG_4_9_14_0_2_um_filter_35_11 TaxID=1975077 RepID=A0A2M8EMI6_UNCKA|nr:MAG: hypothetical protein COV25_02125 [candidate division WWE3 bacterium CG10_big_fil_rev_8_21_14_0_10_35_32]PJC23931.1 MAG: hypothetical protein CO058_00755 [candidate division WWE3 bacterium CG_4_9_14_0_2_um_filter_35_11]